MTDLTTDTDPNPGLFGQLADLGRILRTVRSWRRILTSTR